jgi:porin
MRFRLKSVAYGSALAFSIASSVEACAQTGAEPSPYQLNILYIGEGWDNAAGGIKTGSVYQQMTDVTLSVDAARALGWPGGSFTLEGFWANKKSLNDQYQGALQPTSGVDTETGRNLYRLYQVYYDQNFSGSGTDIRFGIQDLSQTFSNTKPELLFLNRNFQWNSAIDQTGTLTANGDIGPGNYPFTPLALFASQDLGEGWRVMGVVADGVADSPTHPWVNTISFSADTGATIIGEVDYQPSRNTKFMAGLWDLTAKVPTFAPVTPQQFQRNLEGGYIGGATRLYSDEGRRGLDAFATLGFSSDKATSADQSYNAGLTYTGPFDARPDDKAGIAVALNHDPAQFAASLTATGLHPTGTETTFEGTYRAKLFDGWLTLQPTIDYVVNPGYTFKNDLVFGLHFELGHLFDL